MEWASVNAPAGGATQHQRGWSIPAIVRLGHHVDDLVEGTANEVNELKLGHGTESGERRAVRSSHNGGFGDWGVYHPLRAEVVNKAVSNFERAAIDSNVLTKAEDCGIRFHLFPQALADGFKISRLRHKQLAIGN